MWRARALPAMYEEHIICDLRLNLTTLTQHVVIPSPRQAQELMAEIICNVWATALLNDVYACIFP